MKNEAVPPVDDLEDDEIESSEEKNESTSTKKVEGKDDNEPVSEMDKEELKDAIREVQMEDRLKYTVCDRNIEECQMIIKMANKRISDLKSGKSKSSEKDTPLGY